MYRVRLSTVGKASSADRCSNLSSFSTPSKSDQFGYRLKRSVITIGTAIGCHHLTPQQYQHHEVEAAAAAGTIQLNVNEEIVLAALGKRDVKHQHLELYSSQTGMKSSSRQPKGPNKSISTHAGLQRHHHKKRASAKSRTLASSKNGRPRRGSSSSTLRRKPTRRLTRNNKKEAFMKVAVILATDRNEEDDNAVNAGASLTTINRNESIAGALGGMLRKSEEMETGFGNEEENGRGYQPLQDAGGVKVETGFGNEEEFGRGYQPLQYADGVEASGFVAKWRRQPLWKKCVAGALIAGGAIGIGYGIYCLTLADGSNPDVPDLRWCCPYWKSKDNLTTEGGKGFSWQCCDAEGQCLDTPYTHYTQATAEVTPGCSNEEKYIRLNCCVFEGSDIVCKSCSD